MNDNQKKWYQNEEKNISDTTDATEDHKTDIKVSKPIKQKHLKLIDEIRKEENLFRLIVESLCPQICGHHLVKSGLVLSLFSGVHKLEGQSKQSSVRAEIHVLLMGDPGSNKDSLLKAVHSMAPNADYVCGNVSKLNSLTNSGPKRSRTDQHFEKGCLESDDFGICCIDEFEKMDVTQHQVIEEVMEFQTLTHYSEATHYEISGKTSIIGAVNPLNGFYDWSLNIWQNTKLRKSLLSKFDLIFVLVDFPDEEMDSKLSKQIMKSRSNQQNDSNDYNEVKKNIVSQTTSCQTSDCQLMSKLMVKSDEELDLIPHKMVKKYIRYAQNYVNPTLNSEAIDLLEEFCLEFESSSISRSQTRSLETLYRLTEARARVELREVATKDDVLDVIDIVRHSLAKHYKTPNLVNSLNTRVSFKSSKKSQNTKNLLKALKIISERKQINEFCFKEIVEISEEFEIPFGSKDEISGAVDKLNDQSFLLKNNSKYKLID